MKKNDASSFLIRSKSWSNFTVPFLCLIILMSLTNIRAQDNVIQVSGQVFETGNTTMPGVNVVQKGTTNGTVTDIDGHYSLTVPANAVLVFSFMGCETQELKLNGRNSLNVILISESKGLDEVVVVGYGTQKKANVTSAISTVTAETIKDRPVTSLATALQGTAPGLNISRTTGQPGNEELFIEIRGVTSANGSVNPLLIVDGVTSPLGALQRINPSDVESVSVLKDAAAAAIYGSRAAGGVILITTKTGGLGKVNFDYNSQVAIQWPLNVPERLTLLEEAEYSNLARANAGMGAEYNEFDLENIRNGIEFVPDPNNPNKYRTYNQKDIADQILRKRYIMQSHALSAAGGGEKVSYLFSLGYLDQEGVFKIGPDEYKRWNLRSNVSAELTKHLSLDSRISYSMEDKKSPSRGVSGYGLLQQIYQARQRFPIFTPEGKLFGGAGTSGNNTYAYLSEGGYKNDDLANASGTFTLTAKDFIKNLEIKTIYSRQEEQRKYENFNRTVELWDMPGVVYYLNNPNNYQIQRRNTTSENFQFLVDYDLVLGESHKIHFLTGYQWEDYRRHNVSASASSLISNDLPSLNLAERKNKDNSEYISTYANQSFFGRINYNYADKYLIEGTVRSDESSRLAPGSRIKWFYSSSVGWNLHREEWFVDALPFMSRLKLRFSWGQLANANADIIGNYDYINFLNNGNNLVLGDSEERAIYFYQSGIPSSDLSWETVETSNYGLDFALFQNKIQGSFDYYVKYNKNMLIKTVLPTTIGINTPKVNEGELKSWGWELALNYQNNIGEDFSFGIGINLSDNQNELLDYGGNSNTIKIGNNTLIEGYPINTIWGYKTAPGYIETEEQLKGAPFYSNKTGVGDIEYIDVNGDGKINAGKGTKEDHGDLVMLGVNKQRYLFGVTANAEWKNIDFNLFLEGVGRRSIIPSGYVIQPLRYTWIQPMKIHQDYYTPDNPNADFPRPYTGGAHNFATSDRWVLNAAYVRLKNLQLGYSLSEKVVEKSPFSKVRFYLSAQDILTISKLGVFSNVLDPEQRNNAHADYPFSSSLALGINIIF